MPTQITCGQCSKPMMVRENMVGHRVRCPHCGNILMVEAPPGGTVGAPAAAQEGPIAPVSTAPPQIGASAAPQIGAPQTIGEMAASPPTPVLPPENLPIPTSPPPPPTGWPPAGWSPDRGAVPSFGAPVGYVPVPAAQTSGLAIASLVLGVVSFLSCGIAFPALILALIFGHMARSRVASSNGALEGSGMALAGLILAYITLAEILLFIVVGIASAR